MAKKRKHRRKTGARTADSRPPAARTADSRTAAARTADSRTADSRASEPAFWFGFEISWVKLVLARFVVFGLLAIDAVLQIRHAPRYGAGGFNVAQVAGLDEIGPTRTLYAIAELVNAYCFALVAVGVATRILLPIATATYAWLYLSSQLDSYQHHYLVALILLLACFVPWQRPADAHPATRVASWAVRLLLVQLGVMYFWAAISKMNAAWVDGRTLADQIGGPARWIVNHTVGIRVASCAVIGAELALAATVWVPRAWRFAAPLGLAFHLGIAFSTLEIGLFAWLMIALYILVVPDRAWIWLAERQPIVVAREVAGVVASWFANVGIATWLVCCVLAATLAAVSHLDHALAVALVLTGVTGAIAFVPRLRGASSIAAIGGAHLLALAAWLVIASTTGVTSDYYRFWGGSSRRLGDRDSAERAYRRLVDVDPDDPAGHYHLGTMLLARDASDDGLAELHRAEDLEPTRARAYVAEARWLATHGRRDEALDKARAAQRAEPTDTDARDLVDKLTHAAPARGAPP